MNEVVSVQGQVSGAVVPVAILKERVQAIKELVNAVFVENVHFGVIPFTNQRRVLLQPGADQICSMFRIAPQYHVDDLSVPGEIRYRVTCRGMSAAGEVLGEGMGECSTAEEKYKWRKAVCDEEWNDTPETQRRVEYKKGSGGNGHYKVKQIKEDPSDKANTVLKMACKRARVAMVLTVTGCSDDFTQDEEVNAPDGDEPPPPPRAPQSKSGGKPPAGKPAAGADEPVGIGERKYIENKIAEKGADLTALLAEVGIASLADMTRASFDKLKAVLA